MQDLKSLSLSITTSSQRSYLKNFLLCCQSTDSVSESVGGNENSPKSIYQHISNNLNIATPL